MEFVRYSTKNMFISYSDLLNILKLTKYIAVEFNLYMTAVDAYLMWREHSIWYYDTLELMEVEPTNPKLYAEVAMALKNHCVTGGES